MKAEAPVVATLNVISDEELTAFAALHDMLKEAGFSWRVTFWPAGGLFLEVKPPPDVPGVEIAVQAESLREGVTKLGQAMVAAALSGSAKA